MKDIKYLFKNIAFGEISLSKNEINLYDSLNSNIISLCRTLPGSMQNMAMLFLLDYFHIKTGEPVDFMYYYYKPLWTIIPSIIESGMQIHKLTKSEIETAMTGEAMALFLHSLDDHLNDGDIPSSHLMLLLRSQAWLLFSRAVAEFADGKDGSDAANMLINDYYEGVCADNEPGGLEEYCSRFRKEMSTINVMPLLAAQKITGSADFTEKIKNATESFGIAWRILDDIQDAEKDIAAGAHTALYYALPGNARKLWDANGNRADLNKKAGIRNEIYRELGRGIMLDSLIERIVRELENARETVEALGMHGMAKQYRAVGAPVKKWLSER
ncbi:MAG: class 1 isoprenoid biosynthesis enzyme [Spirochaetes bacterium]|nr:class 1 isoprenoid biosynthesis enzyme [Spirochaetota bacterium]